MIFLWDMWLFVDRIAEFSPQEEFGFEFPTLTYCKGKRNDIVFFFFFFEKENDIVDVKDTVQFHSSWTYLSDLEILSIWLRLSLDWKQSLIHQILLDGWDGTCNARNMQEIGMQVKA